MTLFAGVHFYFVVIGCGREHIYGELSENIDYIIILGKKLYSL
jgi:hypothetical protein